MARKPEDRYQTPRDLAHAVELWLAGERIPGDAEPWTETFGRWLGHHRTATTGIALSALLAVVSLMAAVGISAARQETRPC